MGYVNKIYQRATTLIRKRRIDQNEFMCCLEAGICPSCGEELQVAERADNGEKRIICDKECALISPNGVDFQFLNFEIWQKCINNIIRKAANGN